MAADQVPGFLSRFGILEQLKVIFGNKTVFDEPLPVDQPLPEVPSHQHDHDVFGLTCLEERQRLEQLVEGADPPGLATLDELFETLTLLQTGKTENIMVVLVGRDFWERLINWQWLVENGLIAKNDLQLFQYAETAQEAWDLISRHNGIPSS